MPFAKRGVPSRISTTAHLLAGLFLLAIVGTSLAAGVPIRIDGSSTVYPITDAAAAQFQKARKNTVSITVGISGTGGGFRKFCRGETDISNASRPILADEMQACRAAGVDFVELPVAFDALTVVVNPRNTFLKTLTVAQLRQLWEPDAQGRITRWNQIDSAWPDTPIKLFSPGKDSGTFDYFTEAIVGKAKSSRSDVIMSEDDTVLVQGVARDVNALGYFGYAYYVANRQKLKSVAIAPNPGKPAVTPSLVNVVNGTYQPLSRPIFIYVNAKSLVRPEVREFTEFYLARGAEFANSAGYVPLPTNAYSMALAHLKNLRMGTVFSGVSGVGITIEELLKREAMP